MRRAGILFMTVAIAIWCVDSTVHAKQVAKLAKETATPQEQTQTQVRPVQMTPQGSSLPGTPRGLTVFLEGGVSTARHPGDVLTVGFGFQTDEEDGFPPIGSDLWSHGTHPVYIHDVSQDIESMGLWQMLSYTITELADDRRSGEFRVTIPDTMMEGNTYVITVFRNGDAYGHSITFPIWPEGVEDRSIEVLTPNGGEVWARGTERTVLWKFYELETAVGSMRFIPIDRFILSLENDDADVGHYDTDGVSCDRPTNTCSMAWTIPEDTPPGSAYRMRIRDAGVVSIDGSPLGDASDGTFEITAPSVVITAPTGGERAPVFGDFHIRATISGIHEGVFEVGLLQFGSLVKNWNRPAPSDGNLQFDLIRSRSLARSCDEEGFEEVIRAGSAPGFTIRIRHQEWPVIAGESAGFTIVAPPLEVSSPSGGETWRRGDLQQISLDTDDMPISPSPLGPVTLTAELGGFMGTEVYCIARGIPFHEAWDYEWSVGLTCDGDDIPAGTTYRLRVQSDLCPQVHAVSAGDFTITE